MLSSKISAVKFELLSALGLVLVELLCFLPIMRRVGFYLDDWATLSQLYFGPKEHGFWALAQAYGYNNSLVIIRPLEALHFALVFWNFGLNPLPWHITNVVFDCAVAILVNIVVRKLSASRAIGFFAAIFVLLCPTHDSSHYWVVCSSVTLSFVFYLGSLLSTIEALKAKGKFMKAGRHFMAALLFTLSLFNYETFMPLAVLNILVAFFYNVNRGCPRLEFSARLLSILRSAVFASLPVVTSMVLPVVTLLYYLKVIVPSISTASMRSINFDINVFLSTVLTGVELNTPLPFLRFVFSRVGEGIDGISVAEIIRLGVSICIVALIAGWYSRVERDSIKHEQVASLENDSMKMAGLPLIFLGLFTVVVSYTIFGLCSDYPPSFVTLFNRINTGAAFGLALLFSGLLSLRSIQSIKVEGFRQLVLLGPAIAVTAVFTLANFGLSKPWIVSWQTQKQVQNHLVPVVAGLPSNATVLLLNCPRYVMWAPVYDGIWDFQNTARILLNRKNFSASVVSERLIVDRNAVRDVSRGTECGAFTFSTLYLLEAPSCIAMPAQNAERFVNLVEQKGMQFGLQKQALEKWRASANNPISK